MKIKNDFVTNSSSSSFILSLPKDLIDKFKIYAEELGKHKDAYNEGVAIRNISKNIRGLRSFTNDRTFDWASKPRGLRYYNLTQEQYEISEKIIKSGNAFVYIRVDWNVSPKFVDAWNKYIIVKLW